MVEGGELGWGEKVVWKGVEGHKYNYKPRGFFAIILGCDPWIIPTRCLIL